MGTKTNNTPYGRLLLIVLGGLAAAGCAAKAEVVKPVEEVPLDEAAFLRAGETRAPEARTVVARATKKGKSGQKSKIKGNDSYFRYSERFGKDPPPVEPVVAVVPAASVPPPIVVAPPAVAQPTVVPQPSSSIVLAPPTAAPPPNESPPIASAGALPPKPTVPDPKAVVEPEKIEKTDTIDTWEKVAGAKLGESQAKAGKLRATEKGEREVVSALGKRKLVLKKRAYALTEPQLTFIADKLATVSVRVGPLTECRSLLSSMATAWGPATASAELPTEAFVWKGDTIGVRVAVEKKNCWVLVVHRPSAKESDWLSLEP